MTTRCFAAWLLLGFLLTSSASAQNAATPKFTAIPATDEETYENRPRLVVDPQGFTKDVTGLAFSNDGRYLAAAGGREVRVWDLRDGSMRTIRGQQSILGECLSVAFSPDSRLLYVGTDYADERGTLREYGVDDLKQRRLLAGLDGATTGLCSSLDGPYLVTTGNSLDDDGGLVHFQVLNLDTLVYDCAIDLRGKPGELTYFYAGFLKGREIFVLIDSDGIGYWDIKTQTRLEGNDIPVEVRNFASPEGEKDVRCLIDFRPDLGVALYGIFEEVDGKDTFYTALYSIDGSRLIRKYAETSYLPSAVKLNADGTLAATGDMYGEVHIWDTRTGRPKFPAFCGLGRPIYRVAFDESGDRLSFGSTPYKQGTWGFNHYSEANRTFDLRKRRILDRPAGSQLTERTELAGRSLALRQSEEGVYSLVESRRGDDDRILPMINNQMPMCYTLLRAPRSGRTNLIAYGTTGGEVGCIDMNTKLPARGFLGHQDFSSVVSMSESADGSLLATSALDRTIRIWSLENFQSSDAYLDFSVEGNIVTDVEPGGFAEKAGVKLGDKITSADGISIADWIRRSNTFAKKHGVIAVDKSLPQPGDLMDLAIERDGRNLRIKVELGDGGDVVEPLLSLYIAGDEWILWSPEGYYDCSPNGDRLIGWHLNKGAENSAEFLSASQFQKRFYRPDIIDEILAQRDVRKAVTAANAARSRRDDYADLRNDLQSFGPPTVKVLAPAAEAKVQTERVVVRAEIATSNKLPISSVRVLVNGRPVEGKPTIEGTEFKQTLEQIVTLPRPGRNEIQVVASNKESVSEPTQVVVEFVPNLPKVRTRPSLYVLAVGVSKYEKSGLDLTYAHKDAEEFAKVWKRQEGKVYDTVETKVLTNADATKETILDGLDWLLKKTTQHDVAIIFVSGHGVRDTRQNYYMAPHDVDPDRLRSSAVPFTEFSRVCQELPGKVLVFVDTCHSAGAAGAKNLGEDPLRDLMTAEVGAITFASCMAREVSLESKDWGHGAFTRALLDTLNSPASDLDNPGDGHLSITELDHNLTRRVRDLTDGKQHPTTSKPPTIRDFPVANVE